MQFKDLIYNYRKEHRISQEEFGNILGVTKSTVSTWELGKRTPSTKVIFAIARAFDISVDELLDSVYLQTNGEERTGDNGEPVVFLPYQPKRKTLHPAVHPAFEPEYRQLKAQMDLIVEKLDSPQPIDPTEKKILEAYRNSPENVKESIKILLDIK